MPTLGRGPMFHITPVRIEVDAAIPLTDATAIWATLAALVRTLTEERASLTQLLDDLPMLAALHGYDALLVDISPEEIAFRVSLP